MESAQELKISEINNVERLNALEHWLRSECKLQLISVKPLLGDASLRRYFRVFTHGQTFVVMDAPPQENCRSYIAIADALRQLGLHTPEIFHADLSQGFLLITDFGDSTYLKALSSTNADLLYHNALSELSVLQTCSKVNDHSIPPFTDTFMWNEWALHKEWFLNKLLKLTLPVPEEELDECYGCIVQSAMTQPQVFMHRDYHSANLMVLPNDDVGILDFQDAFIGPVTYDLVSLLRDCYIDWPEEKVNSWALFYLQKLQSKKLLNDVSDKEFLRWFDLMGIQRHLKALLTFARKYVRDYQSQYLNHMPRTLNYLLSVSQKYPELEVLHHYLSVVQSEFIRVNK